MIIEESSNYTAIVRSRKNNGKNIWESSRGISKKTRSRKNHRRLEEKFKRIDFGY